MREIDNLWRSKKQINLISYNFLFHMSGDQFLSEKISTR